MSSSPAVLETLNWINSHEFVPVPLKYRTKEMQTAKDAPFPSATNKPANTLWQDVDAAPLNIGVVTGPIAKGPIDVDLDCEEAARLAPFFLPRSSCIFGRASRPNSHYFYKIDTPAFSHISINDPSPKDILRGARVEKPNILELRGDNNQTMLPGSIHPNGEEIEWYRPPQMLVPIDNSLLQRGCNFLSAAVLAARYIWLPGERHESAMQIASIFHGLKYPQTEASNFIKALVDYAGSDDPAHQATVRTTYTRLADNKPAKGALSLQKRFRETNPLMIQLFLKLLGYSNAWLDEYNEKFAGVLFGGRYKIAVLPRTSGDPIMYISLDDFKHLTAGEVIKVTSLSGKVKEIPKADLWLKHIQRRQYSKVTFWPGVLQENMPLDKVHYLNEWTGWPLQPLDNLEKCKAFRTYVERYLTDQTRPEQARWVYTFFAHMLNEPRDKQRAAVVIIGPQKIGKSVFVNYFGKILGECHLNVADAAKIHGRFNYHLKTTIFLHSEEAIFGQDKKHRAIIKDLISNVKLQFEAKYGGVESGESYCRLIYTSNELGGAPLELGDTRHTVFNFKLTKRIPPRELVQALYAEAISDGPAALMHFLQNLPELPSGEIEKKNVISQSDYPTRFYDLQALSEGLETEEKRASLACNLEVVDEYWLNKLESGELFDERLRWAQGSARTRDYADRGVKWPTTFSRTALYADYLAKCGENKPTTLSSYKFFKRLTEWINEDLEFKVRTYENLLAGDMNVDKPLRELSTGLHRVLCAFPSLDKCRKSFEKYAGQKFAWPSADLENDDDELTQRMMHDAYQSKF